MVMEQLSDVLETPRELAMEYIIDVHGEAIKRLIFTYIKNYAQTDDIFQEFLINVYKKLDSYRGDAKLHTWLCSIAINKCKDYLKSPLHRLFLLKGDIQTTEKSKSPEQLSIEEEERERVVRAVFELPVKYREIFVLRYYQELSIKEVSEVLSINESTIKTRIAR